MIYFMFDKAIERKDRILKGNLPSYSLYGGIKLEEQGKAKIINATLKDILKLKRGDVVITNRWRYIIHMKTLGIKVVLINMNSNHDLTKRKGLKGELRYLWAIRNLKLCDYIVCLSETQLPKLNKIGVKNLTVIPLGVDSNLINDRKIIIGKKYLTSGGDVGKDYEFAVNALPKSDLNVITGKPFIPYNEYLDIFAKSKAFILHINDKEGKASDLSGSTSCFEALVLKKPIFINDQPWLKELLKENYYIYKDEAHLRELLKKDMKFKERDYGYLTLDCFRKELLKVVEGL